MLKRIGRTPETKLSGAQKSPKMVSVSFSDIVTIMMTGMNDNASNTNKTAILTVLVTTSFLEIPMVM